jgi:hypothetical protein
LSSDHTALSRWYGGRSSIALRQALALAIVK